MQQEKKKAQRSLNATQIDSGTKVEATAPIVPSVVPTPTNNTDVSEIPTIRSIMSAQTQSHQTVAQLPPGIYTSQDGRQFTINTLRKIRITSASVNDNDNLCLIDGGANSGLAGKCMREYEISEAPERVDIVGASDNVENGMDNLPIATYCSVVTSTRGVRCLGIFHNYEEYEKEKRILTINQAVALGVKCYPEPRKYGGKQKIVTNDVYVFKLKYKGGLSYLPLEYPSDLDMKNLPQINFSSPQEWNPELENDDSDDDQNSVSDEEELDDAYFDYSRDEWLLDDNDINKVNLHTH